MCVLTLQTLISALNLGDQNVSRFSCNKGYSLVLGQCTELIKSKLNTTSNWDIISTYFDLPGLISSIKSVIFKFEDQRYLPLSLHYAKTNFYSFRKHHLSNTEYLEKFTNLVDMAESFEGQLHDKALVEIDSLCYSRASVPTAVCLPYVRGLEPVYVRSYA